MTTKKNNEKIYYRGVYFINDNKAEIFEGSKKELRNLHRKLNRLSIRSSTFEIEREAEIYVENKGLISLKDVKEIYKKEHNEILKKIKEEEKNHSNESEKTELEKIKKDLNLKIYLEKNAVYSDAGDYDIGSLKKVIKVTNSTGNSIFNVLKKNIENQNELKKEYEIFLEFLKKKNWSFSKNENSIILDEREILFAEAVAMYFGIEIAIRKEIKVLYSDCEIVIKDFSNAIGKVKGIDDLELMYALYYKKREFEKLGGEIRHIYGEINPADIGNHKKPANSKFVSELDKENAMNIEEYAIFKKISEKLDNNNQLNKAEKKNFCNLIEKMK